MLHRDYRFMEDLNLNYDKDQVFEFLMFYLYC